MPRNLVTGFKKVATAGTTVDGREIKEQDLIDMAETYAEDEYTALIWPEHLRHFNMGKVKELKTATDSKGRLGLYARLAPNEAGIYWNKAEQLLYTSIEITPNFAKTGKAYLTGLAFTDSPASIGTQELRFSKIKKAESSFFSTPIETDQDEDDNLDLFEDQASRDGLFNFFKKLLSQSQPDSNPNAEDPQDDAMKPEQFNQLIEAQNEQTQAFKDLAKAITAKESSDDSNDAEGGDDSGEQFSSEKFSSLDKKVEELTNTVSELTNQFKTLSEESDGTLTPRGEGAVDDEQEQLV